MDSKSKQILEGLKETIKEYKNHPLNEKAIKDKRTSEYLYRLNLSGMQGFEKNATFNNYKSESEEQKECVRLCREFIDGGGTSLLISGTVGVGKTHLSCATAKTIGYREDIDFQIIRCSSIKKVDYGKPILILDDIGRELGTTTKKESRRSMISEIIEHRHRRQLRTIFTTNSTAEELVEMFGSHIYDRITDKAVICERLEVESYRGR